MKTQLMIVSPKQAREWLASNTENRPLRPGVVERLMLAWERGEWKVTHQGIAFGKSGRLLDGQHRLTFVSALPDTESVAMNVTLDQDDSSFDAIDQGFSRTMGDVYGVSGDLVAASRFIAKVANGSQATGLTHQFVKPFMDWIEPEFTELLTFCPTKKLVWSSAAVRAAAIYRMKNGSDSDFVKLAYNSLVHADVDSMPYAARVLMQQHMSGKIVSARSMDLFCRALRVFDSKNNTRIKSILIQDMSATLAQAKDFINSEVNESPGKAGLKSAKASAKFNWKKTA